MNIATRPDGNQRLAIQDVEDTNLRHHVQFLPDRRNALPHRHGNTIGGDGSIEDTADGLDATGNFLEGLRIDDEGGDFQLLQLGQEVSSEKGTWGQYQIRLQADDDFNVRMGISDFGLLFGRCRIIAKLADADNLVS